MKFSHLNISQYLEMIYLLYITVVLDKVAFKKVTLILSSNMDNILNIFFGLYYASDIFLIISDLFSYILWTAF